jgi:hypothetical protein
LKQRNASHQASFCQIFVLFFRASHQTACREAGRNFASVRWPWVLGVYKGFISQTLHTHPTCFLSDPWLRFWALFCF